MTEGERRVFGAYASFYDALYHDKDYEAECDFLEEVFGEYGEAPVRSVLDLGCGTGNHDIPLATRGYQVVGIDRSGEMVARAREKVVAREKAVGQDLDVEFVVEDVRTFDLGRSFDAVISMFAVISYQISDEDVIAMMKASRRHLADGGLFIFDGWFGPAVVHERPVEKVKEIELPGGELLRRSAVPVMDEEAHTVTVNYRVERRRGDEVLERSEESHAVRYLFPQEIARFLGLAGLRLLQLAPFMHLDRTPSEHDWNFSAVARAV